MPPTGKDPSQAANTSPKKGPITLLRSTGNNLKQLPRLALGRNSRSPPEPQGLGLGLLLVRIIGARNLAAKDSNNLSDPYVQLRYGQRRFESDVVKETLNPIWGTAPDDWLQGWKPEASTDRECGLVIPVFQEQVDLHRLEILLWDQDFGKRKDYLGETSLGSLDWFGPGIFSDIQKLALQYDDPLNIPQWYPIKSTRAKSKVSGEVLVKAGFIPYPPGSSKRNASELATLATETLASSGSSSLLGTLQDSQTKDIRSAIESLRDDLITNTPTARMLNRKSASLGGLAASLVSLGPVHLARGMALGGVSQDQAPQEYSANRPHLPMLTIKSAGSGKSRNRPSLEEQLFFSPASESVGTTRIGDSPDDEFMSIRSPTIRQSTDSDTSTDSDITIDEEDAEDVYESMDSDVQVDDDYFSLATGLPSEKIPEPDSIPLSQSPQKETEKPVEAPVVAVIEPEAVKEEIQDTPLAPPSAPPTGARTPKKRLAQLPAMIRRASSNLLHSGHASGSQTPARPEDSVSHSPLPTPGRIMRLISRKKTSDSSFAADSEDDSQPVAPLKRRKSKKRKPQTATRRKQTVRGADGAYKFDTGATSDDILGIVFIEIQSAQNLPRWRNALRTGWDMDPFCIISFGTKVFRTRVIRHSMNPVWDEKMFFHVKKHEQAFQVLFSVFDWDKMSSNDYVGEVLLSLEDLLAKAAKPNEETGLFETRSNQTIVGDDMHSYDLSFPVKGSELEESSKKQPSIQIRAKFTPYTALRQKFWRTYMKEFDTDESKTYSYVELFSMLDSLGSTLNKSTIDAFFTRFGKDVDGVLTEDEVVICLENELTKPKSEKRRVNSLGTTPASENTSFNNLASNSIDGGLTVTGPDPQLNLDTEPAEIPVSTSSSSLDLTASSSGYNTPSPSALPTSEDSNDENKEFEKLINIKSCPLCHKPRLTKKAEVDIVTHLAVCASQDWSAVGSMSVRNFVTTSQAHRKFLTKIISKVSNGTYQLGANSANIIVQNRMTGQYQEEKMAVYVRLGIRLLYRAYGSGMEGARIRRMLKSMSLKQGVKFDAPDSIKDIAPFIAFHGLDLNEVLEPLESFPHFNAFFYRKLKPGARPVAFPKNPNIVVSCADCRMMAFPNVDTAKKLWIKGKQFSLEKLLGEKYASEASKYEGGAMAIFRLAPQDYHRFHTAVDARIADIHHIPGEYYTVNPIAIRTPIDVYIDNVRTIVPMDSKEYGRVFNICVGAMMVGSINLTVDVGDEIKKGDEFGYYAFGGSTNLILFPPNTVEWDADILDNSSKAIETLVRQGTRIGQRI